MSPGKGAAAASPSPSKSPNITRKGKKTPARENTAFAPRTSEGEVVTEVFFSILPGPPSVQIACIENEPWAPGRSECGDETHGSAFTGRTGQP